MPYFQFSWPLVGNGHIIEYLSRRLINSSRQNSKSLGGTYIFSGPPDLGKTTVAKYFAQSLLCKNYQLGQGNLPCGKCSVCRRFGEKQDNSQREISCGDFHIIKKKEDKKNISITQIRDLIQILSMSSFANSYKIGIIKEAESLSQEAASAFLKTLEEPKKDVVIILISSQIEKLPKTVVSRSQILNFRFVSTDLIYKYLLKKHNISRSVAKNYARLCLGRPAMATKFFEDKKFYDNYLKIVLLFLDFVGNDINKSFASIENLLGKKVSGQEAVKQSRKMIAIWRGVVRDLILLKLGQRAIIQHEIIRSDLDKLNNILNIRQLLRLSRALDKADDYIQSNVNPRLALESVVLVYS